MSDSLACGSLDQTTREVCLELVERYRVDPGALDTGTPENRVVGLTVVPEVLGVADGDIGPEVYNLALSTCGQEYQRGETSFCRFLAGRLPLSLIPDDFNTETDDDATMRADFRAIADRIGGASHDGAGEVERARSLYRFLVTPVAQGGRGLTFDRTAEATARSLVDVHRDRRAACLEFVNYFLAIADLMQLNVVPIERYQREVPHVAVAFMDATGDVVRIIDLQQEQGGLEGFYAPSGGELMAPISRPLLHSYHLAALAMRGRDTDPLRAESMVDRGLMISPFNYLMLTNKAFFLRRRHLSAGDRSLLESAAVMLCIAQGRQPNYGPTVRNLQRISALLETP